MEAQAFVDALNNLRTQLDQLEPDPHRTWKPDDARTVVELARGRVLGRLEEATEQIRAEDPDSAESVRRAALAMVADAAGLAIASGDVETGRRMLKDARRVAGASSPLAAELAAGADAPKAYALLTHGRWLLSKGKGWRGDRRLKQARRLAADGALKPMIVDALTGARPIGKMPTLQTVNGIGTRLYGAREPWPDGSSIATLFFCILYIPLIPISAFRVIREGSSFRVFARYPLGALARGWLAMVGLAAVLLTAALGVSLYLDSSSVRLARDLEQLERTPDDDKVTAVADFLDNWGLAAPQQARSLWAQRLVELTVAKVPRPLTEGHVADAMAALDVVKLRQTAVRGEVAASVAAIATGWLDDLAKSDAAGDTRLALARRASAATGDAKLKDAVAKLELTLALASAKQWPASTIARLAAITGDEAVKAKAELLAAAPSIGAIASVERHARDFIAGKASDEHKRPVANMLAALDARRASEARIKALDEGATAERLRWLETAPDDQEIASRAIMDAFTANKPAAAKRILDNAGPRGWWGHELLVAGGDVALDSGDIVDADQLLDRALAERLPEYTQVANQFDSAVKAVETKLIADANAATLPADAMERLQSASEEEQGRILGELMRARTERDPNIARLRERYEALAPVVGVVLRAGTVKLRRAASAGDEAEQKQLLDGAEQLFLSIQSAAGDDPMYQLGLGEVKYRIHKADEGAQLLEAAAARGDAQLSLHVAQVFRGVGDDARARATAQQVFDANAKATTHHMNAASFLGVLATDPEEELKFLEEADQQDEKVRAQLATARAKKLMKEGKNQEADQELQVAAAIHEKSAAVSESSANNAAVAYLARYSITGDVAHVRRARVLFEKAQRLAPMSQVIVGNLIGLSVQESALSILAPLVEMPALRPDGSEAMTLAIVANKHAWNKAVTSPTMERLAEQQRVLAPTNPMGWGALSDIHSRRKDTAALARLERVLGAARLDVADATKGYREWDPAESARIADVKLARLGSVAAKSPATRAAVGILRADALASKGHATQDEGSLVQALEAVREAQRLWPAVDLRSTQSEILLSLGAVRAAASVEPVKKDWRQIALAGQMLPAALLAGRFPEARAALAARPEWKEALALQVAASDGEASIWRYALAIVVGDSDRAASEKQALAAAPWKAVSARISVLLAPYSVEAKEFAAAASR